MRSLLFIVLAIIIYGSLFPFNFVWVEPASIDWWSWGTQLRQRTTNGDLLSNFLTFVPLGYLLVACQAWPRKSNFSLLLAFFYGSLFACLLQIAQFYIPGRVPALGDAVMNMAGLLLGGAGGVSLLSWLAANPQRALEWPTKLSLPWLLCIVWLTYQLFPFVPNWQWQSLISAVEADFNRPFNWLEGLFHTFIWFYFFYYLARLSASSLTWHHLLGVASTLLLAKLVITHNSININHITGSASALLLFCLFQGRKWQPWLLPILLIAFVMRELFPFGEINMQGKLSLVPFQYYLQGSLWSNTLLLLEKLFIYGCLLASLMEVIKIRWLSAFISILLIVAIELLQADFGLSIGDITDPLLMLFIVYCFRQFSKTQQSGAQQEPVKV